MTRVLLLASNSNLTRHVESLLGHQVAVMDIEQVVDLARTRGIESFLGGSSVDVPDLVILGEDIPLTEALDIARIIDAAHPYVEIVLVAEPEAELVVCAMRAGIGDIVPPSIGLDDLKVLMGRVASSVASREGTPTAEPLGMVEQSRIIVVASPRGGTGKSTVATNIAFTLAKDAQLETVLVDLDLQFGDAGTPLDLKPVHSVADAFESTAALDNLILKTFLTVHPAGFYVLCGSESPTVSDKVSADQVTHLLQQLSSQFRYVVVDTSSGLNECTMTAIEAASDLVLVSTMDLASTRAMRKEIALLAGRDLLPTSRHVVLNFADRHSGVGVREIESALGLPVDVVVSRSQDVLYAGNLGVSVMAKNGGGTVGKAIRQLVNRIHTDEEADNRNKHRGIAVA